MKKIRRSPVVTGLLFLLAVVLLFAGRKTERRSPSAITVKLPLPDFPNSRTGIWS